MLPNVLRHNLPGMELELRVDALSMLGNENDPIAHDEESAADEDLSV